MQAIFPGVKNLDFVTAWYKKAAEYIQGTTIEVAFVSTNSICQGESVAPLWNRLLNDYHVIINFAHQTFKWSNEAKGKAAVFCVIIGFGLFDRKEKRLFHYSSVDAEPVATNVKQINVYLVEASNIIVESRNKPLCPVPPMVYGNKPADGGCLIIENNDYEDFIKQEPSAKKYIRPLLGSNEFINNKKRYCLWLVNASPTELRNMPLVLERVQKCKENRESSIAEGIRKFARTPSLFAQITQPENADYILIPRVSSERRKYVPMGFMDKNTIVTDLAQIVPNGNIYHFGILTSSMHMAWMRYVCGRLEMRYRYSKDVCYNTFPWPSPSDKQKTDIEEAAQAVLDTRAMFPDSSLADLYDPDLMPPDLVKAHDKLDRLVEKAYGKSFVDDAERVAFLFEEYRKLTEGLFAKKGKGCAI